MADTQGPGIESPLADCRALDVVQFGDDVVGIFLRFAFGVAHDHVDAQAVVQRAVVFFSATALTAFIRPASSSTFSGHIR
ncbi:hypothetical protein QW131_04750 [Roseibium salinum]|nr:hypothetical protein [Roseibium salinum]